MQNVFWKEDKRSFSNSHSAPITLPMIISFETFKVIYAIHWVWKTKMENQIVARSGALMSTMIKGQIISHFTDDRHCNRVGTFYPESDEPFDLIANCSSFWHDKKLKIHPMNFTSEEYMDNIQIASYIGMSLNIIVVLGYLFSFRSKIMSESGVDRVKIFAKIAYGFFWPLADSISGNN